MLLAIALPIMALQLHTEQDWEATTHEILAPHYSHARVHAAAAQLMAQLMYAMTVSQDVSDRLVYCCVQVKGVTWLELWQHIVQDCEAALVLRMALDDQNAGVIAAAASALQALTGSRHWGAGLDQLDAGRRPAGCMADGLST